MSIIFDLDIGTLAFFVFSFLVGIIVAIQAIFFSRKETKMHRLVRGVVGVAYLVITTAAFQQLQVVDVMAK